MYSFAPVSPRANLHRQISDLELEIVNFLKGAYTSRLVQLEVPLRKPRCMSPPAS